MSILNNILKIEAIEINERFKKASIEWKWTPQEISDFRELFLQSFLQKYFPFPYRIAKWWIIDTCWNKSASIDCIILNPCHPYTIDSWLKQEKFSIIFADWVDAAIELKPDLKWEELKRSLQQIQSVKKLTRLKNDLLWKQDNEKIKYANKIPSFIFAISTYSTLEKLYEEVANYYIENNVSLDEQVDFIIINNIWIIINNKWFYCPLIFQPWLYIQKLNDDTLINFLFWLNNTHKVEPSIWKRVISLYLKQNLSDFIFDDEINIKLNNICHK